MKIRALLMLWLLATPLAQAAQHHLLIISGIGGIDAYRELFAERATRLYESGVKAGIDEDNIILLSEAALPDANRSHRVSDKPTILQALREIGARTQAGDRVFIVLIGHGNARGDGAAFNLPGPDISAAELAAALTGLQNQLVVIVNTASASGPFIDALSGNNRVVITATSSGREYHATLFGDYFVSAFADSGADTDKDERVSMLEAFAFARRETQRAYDGEKQLLTEHALLDDNGDREGSLDPGEFEVDGALANRVYLQQPPSLALGASAQLVAMMQRKQDLEQSIGELKRQRESLSQIDYYAQLEELLVDLALLSRDIRAQGG
ncbi:MAG: C13 family peptidase [Gammaproteobacteria bacterium]|nr:C13 family peptidase [Gammaproteobacteria bacterium]